MKKVKYFFIENISVYVYNKHMAVKHREGFRHILFLCGLTLDNIYNFVCAECITNPDNENYTKCKNEYGKIDPLAHFYCIMNYFKRQGVAPPIGIQQLVFITKKLDAYIKEHGKLPPGIPGIPLRLNLLSNGSVNIIQATEQYRLDLIAYLESINK